MSGKISFGCDFMYVMRELQVRASESAALDPISDAAAKLFLIEWDFSPDEVDEANKLFWDRFNSESLGELLAAMQRVVEHVSKDRAAQERLVIQLAAIGSMDYNVTSQEGSFVSGFQEAFDLRPSEFNALCERGWNLATALDYFGAQYLEAKKPG